MTLIEYDWQTLPYSTSQSIKTIGAIDLLFFNAGTTTATLDGFPIAPGTSYPINGNVGEVAIARDRILTFSGAGTNLVYVTRRFYTGNIIKK